ncbi:hypothetical protein Rhopal_003355-T1 [Rhodotorula paludigena]|uniref:Uncharacterized protein n=1 Tax=Rhodotorula paludigena TaxID=86838 RepID=A0AAV5GCQ6_9BASI|nr:hypothetical protein Rhopal_003355-T1 [Rhodotorula paludigena]
MDGFSGAEFGGPTASPVFADAAVTARTATSATRFSFSSPALASPRSRTHSEASSLASSAASSSHCSWADSTPDTSAHSHAHAHAYDYPLPSSLGAGPHGDSLLVQTPSGTYGLPWTDIFSILMSSQTQATLVPGSLPAEIASFLASRLGQQPEGSTGDAARPSTAVNHLGANLHDLSFAAAEASQGSRSTQAYGPAQPGYRTYTSAPPNFPPGTYYVYETVDGVAPSQTVGQPFLSPALHDELPIPPSHLQRYSTPSSYPRQLPYEQLHYDPYERRPPSLRSGSPTRPASIRSESGLSARREQLRQTSSPYPRPAYLHASSLAEYGDYPGSSTTSRRFHTSYADDPDYVEEAEPATAVPPEMHSSSRGRGGRSKRALKPLNRESETYLWNGRKGQLSRVSPGVDAQDLARRQGFGSEVIVFPPGSYCKVTIDDLDILPSDSRQRVNDWLRGQVCVDGCAFRFEKKRPSVIRAHVVSCKNRAVALRHDPLKRLCQLQLDAQTLDSRMRASTKARQDGPPPARNSSGDSGDEYTDEYNLRGYGSGGSRRSYASSSRASLYEQQSYASEIKQEAEQIGGSPASNASGPDGGAAGPPAGQPEAPWLDHYGLSVPTGSTSTQLAQGAAMPDNGTRASTSSFLSFED